nr:UvrD-helicase domain-containing protein [Herbaspirillum robiniae]
MPPELDLFAAARGSVTAPAGCGKTQLIADSLALHQGSKPILILTHTNAGVGALKSRLQKARVAPESFRIATIDGFAMRLIGKFPMRSGHNPRILDLTNRSADYPAIRLAAVQLVQAGHINEVLRASYARLIVDEYQDCNLNQHALIAWIAQAIPTCVLGDPMQAIFGFRGNALVNWASDVQTQFPPIGELQTPWRWRLAGAENLGQWLLQVRATLLAGGGIDLHAVPPEVQVIPVDDANAYERRLEAAGFKDPENGSILVIGDSIDAQSRHDITSRTPGAIAVEAVDLVDMVSFASTLRPENQGSLSRLVTFAGSIMTQVGPANFLGRVQSIQNNRQVNPPTPAESLAVAYERAPSLRIAIELLQALSTQHRCRVFRPDVLRCCLRAMQASANGAISFQDAAIRERERHRQIGRPLAKRAVGSTLLLKGLESDVAVVLQPEKMTAPNLYVAMTRGARKLIICSTGPIITPLKSRS